MASKKKHGKEDEMRTGRIAPLSSLTTQELRALVKLAVSRKVLIPSAQGRRVYHALWKKGYTYYVASYQGYVFNEDRVVAIEKALGLRK